MRRLVGSAQLELSSRWREQERQRGEPRNAAGGSPEVPPAALSLL
jgi:hypothetical protein